MTPIRLSARGGGWSDVRSVAQGRLAAGFEAAVAALGFRETGDPFPATSPARPALRIGLCSSISGGFLRGLIDRVFDQPNAPALSFLEGTPHEIVRAAGRGEVDIGFVYGLHDWERLQYEELWREALMVLMPDHDPLAAAAAATPEALDGRTFLVSGDLAERELHLALLERSLGRARRHIVTVPVERATLIDLVGLGFGLTLVTASALGASHPGVSAIPINSPGEAIAFHAVWRATNHNPALARFLALARAFAAEWRG